MSELKLEMLPTDEATVERVVAGVCGESGTAFGGG